MQMSRVEMTDDRYQEVAATVLPHILAEMGVSLTKGETRRRLGNLAKATGIDIDELAIFFQLTVDKIADITLYGERSEHGAA